MKRSEKRREATSVSEVQNLSCWLNSDSIGTCEELKTPGGRF